MRTLSLLALCLALAACDAVKERIDSRLDILRTNEQREAIDSAKCQGLGAQPGTDIFVQCMVGLAQIRATNSAAARASGDAFLARSQAAGMAINPGAYGSAPFPPLSPYQAPATCAQSGPVFHTCP